MTHVKYNGLTVDKVIEIHGFIIEQTGGARPTVADKGKIESVITHIQNDDYYPDFLDKISHLVFGLNKNHAFNDGNKRASLAISAFFLELNDYDYALYRYQHGMEEVVIWIAKSLINKITLKKIIEFIIHDRPLNVAYFIDQAKFYRQFIEPENAPITDLLLSRMVDEWLGNDMALSEETLLLLLDVLPEIESMDVL